MKRLKGWLKQDLLRKTTKNSGVLLSGNIGTALFGLISTAVMVRVLGADLLGQLLFVQWFATIVDKVLNTQSWHAVIKFGSEKIHRRDSSGFVSVVRLGLLIDICTAIVGAVVAISLLNLAAVWFDWTNQMMDVAPFFAAGIIFHISGTPMGVLRVLRKFNIYIQQTLLAGAMKVIAVVLVSVLGGDFFAMALVIVGTEALRHILLLIAALVVMRREGYTVRQAGKLPEQRDFLVFALWTNLKASINLPVQEFDKLVVAQLVSYEALAIYRVFGQLTQFAGKVSTPVNQAVYPEIAGLVVSGRRRDAARLAGKVGLLLLAFLGIPSGLVAFTSMFWLEWIYSPAFAAAWVVFSVMLLGRVALVSLVALEPLFVSNGLVKASFVFSLIGAVLYVPLVWGLAIWQGILGIAISNIAYSAGVALPKLFVLKSRGLLQNARD